MLFAKSSNQFKQIPEVLSKAGRVRRRLLRETSVFGIAVALLCIVAYGVGAWHDAAQQKRTELNTKFSALTGQVATLQDQLIKAEKYAPIYERLRAANPKAEMPLDRQRTAEILDRMREVFFFNALRIQISAIKDMEGSQYANKYMIGKQCEMSLSYEGLTDEYVLLFVDLVRKRLPGKIKTTSFSISRNAEVNDQAINSVAMTGKGSLVKGEMRLVWMGMESVAKPQDAADASAKGKKP